MRRLSLCLLLACLARAADVAPVADQEAEQALQAFEEAFKSKEMGERQSAVYGLHSVRHPTVLKRLVALLKDKSPEIRNVAALALGGQKQDVAGAGGALMRAYDKDYKNEEVLSAVLDAWGDLGYLDYWPKVKTALDDERSAVAIRVLQLYGATKDWRALPDLLALYKKALPKGGTWTTGTESVDTGADGDADQKAAEAKFNAKYGQGGSKARAAVAGRRGGVERNLGPQLRNAAKAITGESFDTAIDFEDWYIANYILVQRNIAAMEGRDAAAAEATAKAELPGLREKVEEDRRKLEAQAAADRKAREGK